MTEIEYLQVIANDVHMILTLLFVYMIFLIFKVLLRFFNFLLF